MSLFAIVALIVLIIFALINVIGREKILTAFFGAPDQGRIVFKSLIRSRKPNTALICPEGFCDNATPDQIASVYLVSADQLREKLRNSLLNELRLVRVHTNDPAWRERYVQRSQTFRFPDTIQVEFIPLNSGRSTIALHSRAQIGYGDGNVNINRLKRWLKRLQSIKSETSAKAGGDSQKSPD